MQSRLVRIQEMLKEQPQDEFLLFAQAQEFRKLGALDEAISSFENLKKINPNYVGLYFHLAAIYDEKDAWDKAEETYKSGMEVALNAGDDHALSELRNAFVNWQLERDGLV